MSKRERYSVIELRIERFRETLLMHAKQRVYGGLSSKFSEEDIVQETLLRALRKSSDLPHSISDAELQAWLRTIFDNLLVSHYRHYSTKKRESRREEVSKQWDNSGLAKLENLLAADQTSPSLACARQEAAVAILSCVHRLPPDMREAIVRRHLESESLMQISEAMKRSQPSVAGLLRRGLKRLKQELQVQQNSSTTNPFL